MSQLCLWSRRDAVVPLDLHLPSLSPTKRIGYKMSINVKDAVYAQLVPHIWSSNLGFARKAIREMVPIIDPEDDYLTIAAAEERMAITHETRQRELHEAHVKLKREWSVICYRPTAHPHYPAILSETHTLHAPYAIELAKVLEAARISAARPPTIPSAEEHVAQMNDLDATRLSLAKAINDAEGALAGKEAELTRLKEETRALEMSDPAAEHDLDATA